MVKKVKKVKRGGNFWDDFKYGFSLPYKAIGELGSAAVGGLLGNGRSRPKFHREYAVGWNPDPNSASVGLVRF